MFYNQINSTVYEIWKSYLPEEHWGMIEYDKGLLTVKKNDKAMNTHGSVEDLCDAVAEFWRIPGNHNVFTGGDYTDAICPEVFIYYNFTSQPYLYKQHVLSIVYEKVNSVVKEKEPELMAVVSYYLKNKEFFLNGVHEMIPYEGEPFANLQNLLARKLSPPIEIKIKLNDTTFYGVMRQFDKILPIYNEKRERRCFWSFVEKFMEKHDVDKKLMIYEKWINKSKIITDVLEDFIKEHPQWFKPGPQMHNGRAIVRLFNTKDKDVILAQELLNEMKKAKLDVNTLEKDLGKMGEAATLNFREIPDAVKRHFSRLEFVVIPDYKFKFRTHYFPASSGGFMVRTLHFVLELIENVISVKKIFQNISKGESDTICDCLDVIAVYLSDNLKMPCFITVKVANTIKNNFMNSLEQQIPTVVKKKKLEISDVPKEGFKLKDVHKEIRRLGLERTFPQIAERLKEQYNAVLAKKKVQVLAERDVFILINRLQFICVLRKARKVFELFHVMEKGCRFGIYCSDCKVENANVNKTDESEEKLSLDPAMEPYVRYCIERLDRENMIW